MRLTEKIIRKAKQYIVGLKLTDYSSWMPFFKNKVGLEIGGPSNIFKYDNIMPVYADAERVDGVNFSTFTVWESVIVEGNTYEYGGTAKGHQFISEASSLLNIADNSYDFVLSSHSLEHCANAIKTLKEWKRVLRNEGVMVIAVPDMRYTFDRQRPITTFSHLLDDYNNNIDEKDLTHLNEILSLHDIERDAGVKSLKEFADRSSKNYENRCLHHHVFDLNLLKEIFDYLDMRLIYTGHERPYHVMAIAQKK